ncbi:hypothetical protein CVT24_011681 [Panaeolus cyanescens]|uniref:Uncharacterized protein n=1 Tax=Panaeolus cyanescens TaxID=181874 RepID=A0A409YH61_9AGAR|nr:hypothetical protein CVT24_011681 [Panaeolus cyanescens]
MMKPKSSPASPPLTPIGPKKKRRIDDYSEYSIVAFHPKPKPNGSDNVKLSDKDIRAKLGRRIALDKRIEELEDLRYGLW